MRIYNRLNYLKGKSLEELILKLENFTIIKVQGKNKTKSVLISVLLHGDESCGIYVLKKFIDSEKIPEFDIYFLVGNINAARLGKAFSKRKEKKNEDFNRIWTESPISKNEKKAFEVFNFFKDKNLIGVLDLHSFNSKTCQSHCYIAKNKDKNLIRFANSLSKNTFYAQVKENLLIQLFSNIAPSVLVECGFNNEISTLRFAKRTFELFIQNIEIYTNLDFNSEICYESEINIKLKNNCKLNNIKFNSEIENWNFKKIEKEVWFCNRDFKEILEIKKENEIITGKEIFIYKNGKTYLKKSQILTLCILEEKKLKEDGFYIYSY